MKKLVKKLKGEGAKSAVPLDLAKAKWQAERKAIIAKYNDALGRLSVAEKRIETLVGLGRHRKSRRWSAAHRARSGNATAGILISDFHCEETVNPEEVNGKNEYSLDIADASIKRVFQKAVLLIEDARNLSNIRQLVVWLGGDIISGGIHEELVEHNQLTPLAACRWASERLESGLKLLVERTDMDSIVVITSHGNHGRDTDRMRSAGSAGHSYEYDMYLDLQHRVQHPVVRWQVGVGYHNYLDVQGRTVRFSHGDALRYNQGVGGIPVPVNKAIAQWNKIRWADLDCFGHWHQMLFFWNWIANGSIIGHSAFSIRIRADFQPPTQTFWVMDKDRGLTRVLPIFCR